MRVGLDFGTTNSSLAWACGDGSVRLCDLDLRAARRQVLRSLLYFSLDARGFVVGERAIEEYLAEDMQGTLIQSIKTFLADDSFAIRTDLQGNVFWYDQKMDNPRQLIDRLKKVSHMKPQPEVQIRGDLSAKYNGVGKVLYACQVAGITKVAFITEPPPLGG